MIGRSFGRDTEPAAEGDRTMKSWRKPKTTEIAVGTEINAYACAGL